MVDQFGSTVQQLQVLANTIILTMRNDLRLRAFHHFDNMLFQHGRYNLAERSTDPDSFITALNSDLAQFDELLAAVLTPDDRK
jgi:hypothetical protein